MRTDFRSWAAALTLAALLAMASACGGKKLPEAGIQTVQAGVVEEIEPDAAERYSATILPNLQVDLAFKSPGLIEEVYQVRGADGRLRDVEAGDKVAEGTRLAAVRPIDYQQKVDAGEASVKQAQAQLEGAKAAFANAGLDYTRAKNLYSSASLVKPDFDRAQAQYDSTQAQVQAAQAAVESARTQADQAKTSLKDTVLQAPFSGFVVARNVSTGSLVGNSTVGFSIIDTHVVKAEFAIPDTSLRGVRLGQRLMISLDARPNAMAGIVTAISPQADPKSRVFSVDLTIPNANSAIRPGMIGSLSLAGAAHPASRLVIPLSAVVRAPANPQAFGVFRIESRDGKSYAVAQPIQIGNTYGNAIEVTSGVSKQERIVALGGELLQNEQEIRVLQ
jgi:RND family efflux transporter MFP subunit